MFAHSTQPGLTHASFALAALILAGCGTGTSDDPRITPPRPPQPTAHDRLPPDAAHALAELRRVEGPHLRTDVDATLAALSEAAAALPHLASRSDVETARDLLVKRARLVHRGRNTVGRRLERIATRAAEICGATAPHAADRFTLGMRHAWRHYFTVLDLEEKQIALHLQIADLLLDPTRTEWTPSGGRYRTPQAQAEHHHFDREVDRLERRKAQPAAALGIDLGQTRIRPATPR